MKLKFIAALALAPFALQLSAQQQPGKTAPPAHTPGTAASPSASGSTSSGTASPLKTEKEKVSYGIGVEVAKGMKAQGLDVDPDVLAKGFKDAFAGQTLLMTDDELRTTLTAFQDQMKQKQAAAKSAAGADNKKEGDAFLAANAKKDGVVTLPSGLQYKVLKAGTGPKPAESDTVTCNYRGTLIDGKEFDSSYSSGQPATFAVAGVIPGFGEALKLMPVGSKWEIVLPPNLAYADQGAGNAIGPNATLIFEVDLIAIQGKP